MVKKAAAAAGTEAVKIAGKYVLKHVIEQHMSEAKAAEWKELLGLETKDLEPLLKTIGRKIDTLAIAVAGARSDGLFERYNKQAGKLSVLARGYERERGALPSDGGDPKEQSVTNLSRAALKLVLEADGLYDGLSRALYSQGETTGSGPKSLLEKLRDIYEADHLSVLDIGKRVEGLLTRYLGISRTLHASCASASELLEQIGEGKKFSRVPLFDGANSDTVQTLDEFNRVFGDHLAANKRLRQVAAQGGNVQLFYPRWSLYLTGMVGGRPKSEVSGVGTGASHGNIRREYIVPVQDNVQKNGPPQIMVTSIAAGADIKIDEITNTGASTATSLVAGHAVGTAAVLVSGGIAAPAAGFLAAGASELVNRAVRRRRVVSLNHTTRSQSWELKIKKTAKGEEQLTLRNIEANAFLGGMEDKCAYLTRAKGQTGWLPILERGAKASIAHADPNDLFRFKLRSAHDKGHALCVHGDLRVSCKNEIHANEDGMYWSFITQSSLPSNTRLYPGNFINSLNGAYQIKVVRNGRPQVLWNGNLMEHLAMSKVRDGLTDNEGIKVVIMQEDGNLVAYGDDDKAVYTTDTHGNNGAALILHDSSVIAITGKDGKVVKYLRRP